LLKKLLVRVARQSPAMIVAMLALFVALTGTAVATTSALIGSAQIKNNSITGLDVKNKSLRPIDFRGSVRGPRGLRGLTGATGATGAAGAKGDKGDQGVPGPFPDSLPAGKTVRGNFALTGVATAGGQRFESPISFVFTFSGPPTAKYIPSGGPAQAGCPGTVSNPLADPGFLCVYELQKINTVPNCIYSGGGGSCNSTNRYGGIVYAESTAAGAVFAEGTWAATAAAGASVTTAGPTARSSASP
jgi:hypothetical protein